MAVKSRDKRLIKDRRAVNPVIATLLMTVIVTVLAITAWGFYSGFLTTQTTRAGEMLSIDTVSFPANGTVIVYARNIGDSKLDVSSIYIDGQSTDVSTDPNAELLPGEVYGFSVSYAWTAGETYNVKVVTTTGAASEGKFTAT